MGRQVFTAGEILTAASMNDLGDQTVMVFDDATDRATAIPTPVEGMVTYLKDTDAVEVFKGAAFAPIGGGFTARTTITATNATFSVPALAIPIVKVTVIGGGGGGAAGNGNNGSTGGTTTFNAGGAGSVSATGGTGGKQGNQNTAGDAGTAGDSAGNFGGGGQHGGALLTGTNGLGGVKTTEYLDLTGISTVNVTIGAGGAGGTGTGVGGAGGRGEVILEFVAA